MALGRFPSSLAVRGKWGDSILRNSKALDEVRVPGRRGVGHLGGGALLSVPNAMIRVSQDHWGILGLTNSFSPGANSFSLVSWGRSSMQGCCTEVGQCLS